MAYLANGVTTTGAGSAVPAQAGFQSVIAHGTTTAGAGAATINIEVCHDPTAGAWIVAGTLTITLETTVSAGAHDGMSLISGWRYIRANITAISGTGAAVTVVV